jgi:drug/metabolite transporter (DMT)-like permease
MGNPLSSKLAETHSLEVHASLFCIAIVWGLNITLVKSLTQVLDITLVASLRMVIAVCVLTLVCARTLPQLKQWSRKEWLLGLLASVLMVYANQVFFAQGLSRTSATNAALIIALGPLVSALLEALIFKKPLTRRYVFALLLALSGVTMVITHRPGAGWQEAAVGDALMFSSVLVFALGGALTQRLTRHVAPLSITWLIHVVGTLLLVLDSCLRLDDVLTPIMDLSWQLWGIALFSGSVATAVGAVIWSKAISAIGVGKTAAYLSWVPILGVGFAALLLNEPLTIWHGLGVLLVLLGTMLSWPTSVWKIG